MERVYVAGVSMTPFGKFLDKSVRDLTRKAGADALRDANCEAGLVDAKILESRHASLVQLPCWVDILN